MHDPLICALPIRNFRGADNYPFKYCKKIRNEAIDIIDYMNNVSNLSHFRYKP